MWFGHLSLLHLLVRAFDDIEDVTAVRALIVVVPSGSDNDHSDSSVDSPRMSRVWATYLASVYELHLVLFGN